MLGWWKHDQESVQRMGIRVAAAILALLALPLLLTRRVAYIVLALFFIIGVSIVVLWNPDGWEGYWSMRVILPGDQVRSLILKQIEQRGSPGVVVESQERKRYSRKFENPIEVSGGGQDLDQVRRLHLL